MEKETEEILNGCYDSMAKELNRIKKHNDSVLKKYDITSQDVENVLNGVNFDSYSIIEVVEQPSGEKDFDYTGVFKEVYVYQYNEGIECDSYAGFIYCNIEPNLWIKIPYTG